MNCSSKLEDESFDTSMDWANFSCAEELYARKSVFNEWFEEIDNVESCICNYSLLGPNNCNLIESLQSFKNNMDKNIKDFEDCQKLYDDYLNKKLKVNENIESLSLQTKTAKEKIVLFEEEMNQILKSRKVIKVLNQADDCFRKNFDFNVSCKELPRDKFLALVKFPLIKATVKFTIDQKLRKVTDFEASELCSAEEENELKEKFSKLEEAPKIVMLLRNMALKKLELKNN